MGPGGAADILFVEDNPHDVVLTLRALRRCGLEDRVRVVNDGKEAVDYVFRTGRYRERPLQDAPRLMLLDLKLPKMTGLQVLQWIRADPETQSMPVIILTTFEDDRDVVEIFRLGVTGYLVKPIDVMKFYDIAKGILVGLRAPEPRSSGGTPEGPGSGAQPG